MFLKAPMIIIMKFGENIVLRPKYIDIYEFRGGTRGMYIICLLLKKNGKRLGAWPILESNSTLF